MPGQFEISISKFTEWRRALVADIDEFRTWQDSYGHADIEQTLRIYDMVEGLRTDHIRLTLIGESAIHKIALINALLFPDTPGGLLPANAESAAYTCATEIFYDPNEPPYVRLLPIDTRKRGDSIATLRRSTIEWVTTRLDANSEESVASALASLSETRFVSPDERRALNLWNDGNDQARVPTWRYALINLPLPALQSGLVAFYTPGFQMLSVDPEVVLRMAGSSQALLMVLGDSLTSDAQAAWRQYVQSVRAHKFLVFGNGASPEVVASAAQTLGVPTENAQAGTVATVSQTLEARLAESIVPERQALLLNTVAKEIGPLVQTARQAVAARFIATVKEMQELSSTAGKTRESAQESLNKLEAERKEYQRSVSAFNVTYADLMARGQELLATLHDERIEEILGHDKEFIQGAWTTAGMWKNMQGLFAYFTEQVAKIIDYAAKMRQVVDSIYDNFHSSFGLAKLTPPRLSLEKHLEAMQSLKENARSFCHDPINVATYKPFLIKKFYDGLVEEARLEFELTRLSTERWLRGALGPLNSQIMERQSLMLKRVEALRELKDNMNAVKDRIGKLDIERQSLKKQGEQLDSLRARIALANSSPQGTVS